MDVNIYGTISFDIDFDIEATSEEEALAKATEQLKDYYRLEVHGAHHIDGSVKMNIGTIENIYDDE